VLAQHFPLCPRAAASGPDQGCTIVEWRAWTRHGNTDSLDFQVVLYHQTWEIVLQYRALDGAPVDWAPTLGIQDRPARSARTLACDAGSVPAPASARCLFDPRFPPGTAGNDAIFSNGFEAVGGG
jgi:hypothetical protein